MKRLASFAAVLVLLVAGATGAEAANGGTTVSTTRVGFVLASPSTPSPEPTWAICPNLPAGAKVTGSGTETSVTTVATDAANVTTIENATYAHGTATDRAGKTYRFFYANQYRIANTAAAPDVFSGLMTDAFSLAGNGPANLRNGFVADFTTTMDLSTVSRWSVQLAYGDPIAFIPGPFVAVCDPL